MNVGNVNTYTYGYDAYGRLNGITTPAGSFAYTRPADSDLVGSMTRPNGVNSTWTFEGHRNLLASVTNGSVSTYAYTNDAIGRRTGVTRSGSAFADTNILTYGYNPRSELTSALSNVNANYNFAYSYDPIGNRLNSTLAGTNWNYTANNLNQYTAFTSGSTTQDPTYDADGNMLTRDGWTQTWNGENRLIETYNETTKLTFSYDYMGRRIEKKVFQQTGGIWAPQKSLQYVYDGYKLVEEIDILPDEKPVLRRYTWQPETQGVDVPLVVTDVASNQNYFYTADANKNISELVDANGNTVAHYEYNPFGKITIQSGAYANNNPFQFSSEYFDSETSLVYYNYRYYSPQLGRWINKDPIGEQGGWNLYGMVGNNSIGYWDRKGLRLCCNDLCTPGSYLLLSYRIRPKSTQSGQTSPGASDSLHEALDNLGEINLIASLPTGGALAEVTLAVSSYVIGNQMGADSETITNALANISGQFSSQSGYDIWVEIRYAKCELERCLIFFKRYGWQRKSFSYRCSRNDMTNPYGWNLNEIPNQVNNCIRGAFTEFYRSL